MSIAVSFARKPTIGRIRPNGTGEVFLEMPSGSLANGIRFDQKGIMFVADYIRPQYFAYRPEDRKLEVFAHDPTMNQPNDLAISSRGTLVGLRPGLEGLDRSALADRSRSAYHPNRDRHGDHQRYRGESRMIARCM